MKFNKGYEWKKFEEEWKRLRREYAAAGMDDAGIAGRYSWVEKIDSLFSVGYPLRGFPICRF